MPSPHRQPDDRSPSFDAVGLSPQLDVHSPFLPVESPVLALQSRRGDGATDIERHRDDRWPIAFRIALPVIASGSVWYALISLISRR